jgi:ElaA protein
MLIIKIKIFKELTTQELYSILQLRSEVFVVEQNCVYQDIDGNDKKALHVLGFKNETLVAYTRLLKSGDYFKQASISRVVVSKNERQHKFGYDIMKASIKAIKKHYNEETIIVSAQAYLKTFYNNLNFVKKGKEYLEDGIPHIKMIKAK